MTSLELGGAIIGVMGVVSGYIVRDRQIFKAIRDGDCKCHDRINSVAEKISDTREKYATKDDLQQAVNQIQISIDKATRATEGTNQRLDTFIQIQMGKGVTG